MTDLEQVKKAEKTLGVFFAGFFKEYEEVQLRTVYHKLSSVMQKSPTGSLGGINVKGSEDQGEYSSIGKIGELNVKRTSS